MTETKLERKDKLLAFLKRLTADEKEQFAHRVGTTLGQLSQIAYGQRPCNTNYAVNIDRETKGEVPMQEMHPELDWDHVFSALHGSPLSVNWELVKEQVHEAVAAIDFGKRVPVVRSTKNEPVRKG